MPHQTRRHQFNDAALVGLAIPTAVLYGVARLVRAFDELHATRIELAQSAVGNEQLRLSRDLHDPLGPSLTAVSLKGDLAPALLPTDRRAAEAEIRELTAIARDALRGSRTVTRGERTVSLRAEVDRAARLLDAADIDTDLSVTESDRPCPRTSTTTVGSWAATTASVPSSRRYSDRERQSLHPRNDLAVSVGIEHQHVTGNPVAHPEAAVVPPPRLAHLNPGRKQLGHARTEPRRRHFSSVPLLGVTTCRTATVADEQQRAPSVSDRVPPACQLPA